MKVSIITIIVDVLGTVPKNLKKKRQMMESNRERLETIQITKRLEYREEFLRLE